MSIIDRRQFAQWAVGLSIAGQLARHSWGAATEKRMFTLDLCPGRVGVNTDQRQTIELAAKYGFESIEPNANFLVKQSTAEMAELNATLKAKGLIWGAGGLTVDFRNDEASFQQGIRELPQIASALQAAGVSRVGTWITPSHAELTYNANFTQHVKRLRQCGQILHDHGLRLGLEYVGPRTSWTSKRFAFIHTLAETQELLAAIGLANVGVVLDSWHWYTAEETTTDLEQLTNADIVAVDLNDAPEGIDVRDQIDNRRELPAATGVIDIVAFLRTLLKIGYDGPIRAEPFNRDLNAMDDEDAVAATAAAMKEACRLAKV